MTLGHLYADAGEYDKAVECYRMALPHYRSKDQEILPLAWEALDQEDPFDPKMHVGFGEMFQRFGELQQAEMEYKQALTLAPEDNDATAKLAQIAAMKLLVNRDQRPINPAVASRDKHYVQDLSVRWLPPAHQRCLVTRCGVSSDSEGHVSVSVVGQSGSSQHDQSVLSVLQAADFSELFYFHKAGVFEFACMSDGDAKTIAFTEIGGECDFDEPTPNEQLSWQIQDVLKRISKQTGVLRL
jgi:tetratricopeptide (TPR) repeat protein